MKKHTLTVKMFNDFYNNVYRRWRLNNEKAAKDIVGEEYESFRKNFWLGEGFELGDRNNVLDSGVKTDLVIMKEGEIIAVEEDKGSYVDGTFLSRAISDCVKIFGKCLKDNKPVPFFILSCPTKMKNFEVTFESDIEYLRADIQDLLRKKFIYLPLCDNGRVNRKKYFKTPDNHYKLSENNLNKQKEFIEKIKIEKIKNNERI